jgi:hypothetical protein
MTRDELIAAARQAGLKIPRGASMAKLEKLADLAIESERAKIEAYFGAFPWGEIDLDGPSGERESR